MLEILNQFKNYCTNPNIKSGKASSYAKAIEYLCDFLNISEINNENIIKIEESNNFIRDNNSDKYKALSQILKQNGRESYLTHGYIKAAIPQFLTFYNKYENGNIITKVKAIEKVVDLCGGSATWDDIYSKIELFYPNIKSSIEWKAGIRGVLYRELRNNKTFKRNSDGSFSLLKFNEYGNSIIDEIDNEIINFISLPKIDRSFDNNKCLGVMPTADSHKHKYNISKTSGTINTSLNKAWQGRKAEKYFLDFLKSNQFVENIDYFDVANDKNFGYDINFLNLGLEIKNIKNGYFYLSDNEIALIENNKTILILIDIDNGIWIVKRGSLWLKSTILNIKEIRQYCLTKYPNIDLTDIKINIDDKLEGECCEISQFNHKNIVDIFLTYDKFI